MKSAVFSCVAGFAVAAPSPDVLAKFHEFRSKWGHTYVGTEYQRRAGYFEQTLHRIEDLQRQERGTAIYSHLGPFSDLSPDEMAQRSGVFQAAPLDDVASVAPVANVTLGDSFDWVAKGAVNPVKDQGQCGSCWSFSTVCNLEGTGFLSSNRLVSLSEQNIMDCDKTCYSCNGGLPSLALTWSSQNGGVASEALYPYKAHDESCKNIGKLAHNKGYIKISQDEDKIAQALVQYGPLSIAVDATPFQTYHGGVMNNPSCSKTKIDHAVNIVGYGSTTIQYWKIRNSWSASWGEAGYIRVSRGDCTCALCTTVVTATGVTISASPSPTPPTPPPSCENKVSWCPSTANWECQFLAAECQKSCGCCDSNPPSYCTATPAVKTDPQSIFDEIKKLVCQYIANGTAEAEAEKLICSQFGSEVAICDEVVKILWSELETQCAASVVV